MPLSAVDRVSLASNRRSFVYLALPTCAKIIAVLGTGVNFTWSEGPGMFIHFALRHSVEAIPWKKSMCPSSRMADRMGERGCSRSIRQGDKDVCLQLELSSGLAQNQWRVFKPNGGGFPCCSGVPLRIGIRDVHVRIRKTWCSALIDTLGVPDCVDVCRYVPLMWWACEHSCSKHTYMYMQVVTW